MPSKEGWVIILAFMIILFILAPPGLHTIEQELKGIKEALKDICKVLKETKSVEEKE